MELNELITRRLLEIVDELKAKHIELGMKATGKWLDSLEIIVTGSGNLFKGVILGQHYTEQLTKGRAGGKRPPIAPIEEWVKAKFGLSGKQALGVAFAVATKIGKEGTTWFKNGGSDLLDAVLTRERVRRLQEEIGLEIAHKIADNLKRQLQGV